MYVCMYVCMYVYMYFTCLCVGILLYKHFLMLSVFSVFPRYCILVEVVGIHVLQPANAHIWAHCSARTFAYMNMYTLCLFIYLLRGVYIQLKGMQGNLDRTLHIADCIAVYFTPPPLPVLMYSSIYSSSQRIINTSASQVRDWLSVT